jgi:hypothetical protein
MRTQEIELAYAIRCSELNRKQRIHLTGDNKLLVAKFERTIGPYVHNWSERAFNTVFFDWTCQYGMSPSRPLLLVGGSVFSLLSFTHSRSAFQALAAFG